MKSDKATKRQVHRGHSRLSSRRRRLVQRAAEFKLESLEERTLLSTTKVIPPQSLPLGLGAAYTTLSQQAHGVGLNTGSPTQYTGSTPGSPATMADLTAYLKKLTATLPMTTGDDQVRSPNSPSTGDAGKDKNPFEGEQVNPQEEVFGKYAPNLLTDPGNYLQLLAKHPELTGLSHSPLLPSVISGFDGMNFLDSVQGFVPPSTGIAVGPDFVVETINSQIQFYDKATGTALLPNTPLSTFFTQAGGEIPVQPVVTYDDIAGRFIVAAITLTPDFSAITNHLLLAVSNDSNPLDGFFQANYQLDIGEGGFLPDIPKIGWNADEVVITSNMYTGTGAFDHVQVLSFAASSIFSATPPPTLTLGTDYFSVDRFSGDFGMAAASMHEANPGDPMYFVEENTFADGSNLRVVSANDLLSGSPVFTDTVVPVSPYTFPPAAAQPGGTIATDDTRILNAEYWNGRLVAGQNVGSPLDSDAHARWYEFDVTGSPSLIQDGTIAPAQGTSTYFPAISIAPGGAIGMVYNESSDIEFASVYVTGRSPADPAGLMETPTLAKAGTATYSAFAFAWGDYNGIAVDPAIPGTFWGGAEYATADLSGLPANWATWITHFVIVPTVVSSDPAPGSVVTGSPPTTFSLTFDEPIDPASINAGDFTVDGIPADSATLSGDGLTITYTYNTSPVTSEGPQSMALPAGSVKAAGDEIGNVAFTANFYYVQVQLQVTATSPPVGSVVTAPFTDLVVQFNKPFDISSINTSDFQLSQGTVVSAVPLTPQAIELTLSGVDHDGTLTLSIPAGALLDMAGVPNAAFTGTYIVDITSTTYPTPLGAEPPAGSLIYDPSISGSVAFPGDTDSYTLPLAANQTLTLVLTVDPGLIGTLAVVDPDGNTVASVTGASAGQTVVLQTAPVTTAGTYSLVVGGDGGTTGGYTLQAVLNAAYKLASDTNNSIASAYDLSGAFASLGTTPAADRAGVLGTIDPAADPDFYKFHLDAGQSATLAAAGRNDGQVSLALYDSAGNLLALGKDASLVGPLNFGGGFSGASSLLALNGFANLSGSTLDLTDGGFGEAGSAFSKNALDVASFQTSFHFQIQPSSTSPLADGFTFTIQGNGSNALGFGGGDLGYGGIGNSVAIKFDYYDNAGEGTDSTGIYTNGQDPFVPAIDLSGTGVNISSGDVMDVSMSYDGSTLNVTITDTVTGASASQSYSVDIPSIVGGRAAYVGFTGGTGGLTSIPAILDWNYTPGQNLISTAKFESINNFVATTAGWYYAQVGGDPGTDYSLVVTRDADFTLHGKNFDKAQPLDGVDVVLGAIVKGGGSLFTLDDQLYGAFNPIWRTDPATGTFIPPSIPQPGSPLNNPFGLNLAYDGTNLYFNSGAFFGTGELDKLDPATGAVLLQTFPADGINYGDIAYLDGKIYATDLFSGSIDIFDSATLTYQSTISSVGGLSGLAGDPDRGVLWGVAQGFPTGTLYEIDPATGAVIASAPDNSQGAYEQDLAYSNGMLIVSDTYGNVEGQNYLDYYDPSSLMFLQRLPVDTLGFVSGLGGDGVGSAADDTDYYSINVNAGDTLHIATSTPAGGPNEFVNNLYPELLLYDQNGNVVAIANGNAPDGRNSVIDFTIPDGASGTWYVQIAQSPSTPSPTVGEYGLQITGATGALAPFTVTSTIPADGALVQPPTDYIVNFSQPVLGTSLTPGELTVNGVPAIAVTLVDANTVDWTLDPAYIVPGNRVLNTVVISADPATGQRVEDVSGAQLADFTSTFTTDTVPPEVIDSTVHEGDVFSPAPYDLTEVVTFSEPMDTAFTTAASFDLFGIYRNQHIAASSFSWSADGTQLTITYDALPDDAYTLTLFASGFQDLVGHPLSPGDFTVDFAVALGTAAFPVPFKSIPPLGDLIYTESDSHVLVTSTDVDNLTVNLDPGQTLTVLGTPSRSGLQLVITVLDPGGNPVGTATAPAPDQDAVLETAPVVTGGVYTIRISDANGNLGLYSVQAYLNASVKSGTSNISIATAQDISGSSYLLGPGNADRLGVVGSLPDNPLLTGQAFVSARYEIFYDGVAEILRVDSAGNVVQKIPVDDPLQSLAGVELSPFNNMLYAAVTTSFNDSSVSGELIEFDPNTGKQVGVITLPDDPANNFLFYPYGFAAAADGTFWVAQPNSNNLIHVDASGNLLASFSTGTTTPESASLRGDGNVYFSGYDPGGNGIYLLDTSGGTTSLFASTPNPDMTKIAATGGVWEGDYFDAALRFDDSGNLLQQIGYFGSIQAQSDSASSSANIWTSNFNYWDLFRFDQAGNQQLATFAPGALGLSVWGVDNPNAPPQDTQDYYKFDLVAGQSATIVAKGLNGKNVQLTLVDGSGNVLATGVGGSTNVDSKIENFVAGSTGTYYVEVTGDPGVKYSLTVTRSANFDIEPNNTSNTAQSLTGTNGVLGASSPGGTLVVGNSFEGIDFLGSNCGCLPPDTNAAVGGNYVVETVNVEIRVFDKNTGSILLDEPLAAFFGAGSGGDPYVVYDDIANRWYVSAFDSSDTGLFLAVSNDANPLDGFLPTYHLANLSSSTSDYAKLGFNKDGIFLSYNDFNGGGGAATVASIDKAAALSGTLSFFISTPPAFTFRGMPPAQMHGDTTGGTEWFFSTDGSDVSGSSMRVTKMTNYLSDNPTYTITSIPVAPYQGPVEAEQPGGTWTVFPNTTTYQTQYRNGFLVTAMASGTAADGFFNPKGLYYEVDVSSGTPVLVTQGVIDPGPGVSVQMPSVDIDNQGNLGFGWMEASSTEFLSMWVGSLDTQGHFSSFDAAPGGGFFAVPFRIGDYSTVVLDPTDGKTFWAANEYIGADGDTDIWRTHITSFSLPPAVDNDWYSINVAAGNSLDLQTYTPSDGPGEFVNTASLELELYDTFGNLVATGTKLPDGRNVSLSYNAPLSGEYRVRVFNDQGTSGEYFLSVATAQFPSGGVAGQVFNDLDGNGNLDPGEPGLANWEVDVFDSSGVFVAAQMTDPAGDFNIQGLPPGTYTVEEVLQAGWTQTTPVSPDFFTVTVTAGNTVSGLLFGNFQNITISGEKFNDLNGDGVQDAGDPGLPGWTIDLVNAAGSVVATTVTDSDGNYSFTGVGPGSYTVQEELQPGWMQTFPAPPGTYTVTATSGGDQTGLLFGNFQLVTFSGQVYNDLNGDGSNDGGTDPGLQGWTVNLLDASGNLVATTASAADGTYSFANVGPGLYTIEEINQAGWYQTQPVNPPGTYTEQATSSDNVSGLDFGNFQLVNVTGEVYNDLNGNGSLDPGDPGLQGWTVNLLDASGNLVATTTSDSGGNYGFDSLFPGTFTIEEILQSGWTQTQPTPIPPGTYTITTQSGMNPTGLDFGNFKTFSISGSVYNDLDGNGLKTNQEPNLSGWTINLLDSSGNVIATQTSDANGNYTFTGVGPGKLSVAEVVQANWVQTQPLYPTVYTLTGKGGHNLTALNFGDHASPALSPVQVIDNGQPGYAETGTWSTATGGFNGTNRVAQTTHGSGATATASWTFTGLSSAFVYDVYVTFATKSIYSKAAPFTMYDGSTSLGTQFINESILVTQAQGGRNEGSYGGVGWVELRAAVSVSSGTLEVLLGNNASGNFVDADGVLLVSHGVGRPQGSSPAPASSSISAGPLSIGTLDATQPESGTSTKKGSGDGSTTAATVAISGVTQPSPVAVVYSQAPAQSSSTSPSVVDMALSQNGNGSTQNGNGDLIGSLALELLSRKKVIA